MLRQNQTMQITMLHLILRLILCLILTQRCNLYIPSSNLIQSNFSSLLHTVRPVRNSREAFSHIPHPLHLEIRKR